jgi:hypothetical protein
LISCVSSSTWGVILFNLNTISHFV